MTVILKKRYTMKNVRKHHEPYKFAQIIIRGAKSVNMPIFSQIYLIYSGLKLEFRRDLFKPTEGNIMEAFLHEMDENKKIWSKIGCRTRHCGQSSRLTS